MTLGDDFLEALVGSMRRSMDVNLALITLGEGGPPPTRARALYACKDGSPVSDVVYDLKGEVCEVVYGGVRLVVPRNLGRQFPQDADFESYVGVPLFDIAGVPNGHLAVFSRTAIGEPATAESIVRLFGLRAEAECRRAEADRKLRRLLDEQRTLSGRLAKRYRKVHEANTYKTRLMAMIAHDLRSPLAALVSRAEFIEQLLERDTGDSDRVKASCEDIIESAERMARLIGTILDQAREEADRLVVARGVVNFETAITVAVDANRDAAAAKSIRLDTGIPEPIHVEGDEDLLIQAVDNLVANAIKYSHPETTVQVAAALDGDTAILRVSDQGQGLTEEDLSRAFGEFATLSARPTGGEASLGLGLATVRRIVEAHDGEITAASDGRGGGATFTIRLPAIGAAEKGEEPAVR